ncbi:thermonuclease family protein [Planctomycetota bacterium]|nr:thermonuclease family protein [Planctomycetota bacterium]
MRLKILYLFALVFIAGCTGPQSGDDKGTIGDGLGEDLVTDNVGRIIGHPTHLEAPDKFIINGGTPTEREIRLLGVEGLSEEEAPKTTEKIRQWMYTWVRDEQEIFIAPGIGTHLSDHVIYGIIYLQAKNPETGDPMADGYVVVNVAMLHQGLVKIRDINEIENENIRKQMLNAEAHAKRQKLGLWSKNP